MARRQSSSRRRSSSARSGSDRSGSDRSGSGRASIGAETLDLFEGQSLDIAIGAAHAIYNHGKVPLHMIEVQMGICLGAQDHEPLTV